MRPEIIAHRGYSARAPENTVAAFDLALSVGALSLEWDIQRSADGVPVVIHDETLDRTTDGAGPVDAQSVEALRRLDAGSWFGPAFSGEPIPTLATALDAVAPRAQRLYPELKRGASPAEVDRILSEVEERDLLERTVFISMDWEALDRIERKAPRAYVGYIVEKQERYAAAVLRAAQRPRAIIDPDYRIVLADPEETERALGRGVPLAVWTVNSAQAAEALWALGVSRFTTNEVEILLSWAATVPPTPRAY